MGAPDHTPAGMGAEWQALEARMRVCRKCSLAEGRTQVVTYRGGSRPWLLLVGEAPGRSEDEQGVPFVGRAGKILDEAIRGSGLRPGEWGITNVIMCRPPKNRFDPAAATACRPWLDAKIATLAPRALVTLGSHALEAFLPEELPISKARGRVLRWQGLPVFPMLHPAATLRRREFAAKWREDWTTFQRLLPELHG
jgi:uracil-DNA glycosylase